MSLAQVTAHAAPPETTATAVEADVEAPPGSAAEGATPSTDAVSQPAEPSEPAAATDESAATTDEPEPEGPAATARSSSETANAEPSRVSLTASKSLSLSFRAYAEQDRRRRMVSGITGLTIGGVMVAGGVTLRATSDETGQQLAGTAFLATGVASLIGGIIAISQKAQSERFVASEEFLVGSRDGWTDEQLRRFADSIRRNAVKTRRRRLVVGGVQTGLGVVAAGLGVGLLASELRKNSPGAQTSSAYGQVATAGVGLLVQGIVALASPTPVESVAAWLDTASSQ